LGSRDVIGQVTIRLPGVDYLWVIHGDHASIWHSYGDMAPQMLDALTWKRKKRRYKRKRKKGKERKGKRKVEGEKEEKEEGKGKERGKER